MSDPEITPSEPEGGPDAAEIVNPEDIAPQIEVTERDGVSRIDISDDAETRPGEVDPGAGLSDS
ncbi:MAG: multidrug transporter [Actinomycetota bacterium]|nr:multidrug transporter [Actinomycetota bacterium]MDQ2698291.1 multidrug transporter [Actinomycetota bacterium]